jgi:hypothetical protein
MHMITPKGVNIYGYLFLFITVILLILVWYNIVPQSMHIPIFLVVVVLYLIRITLRLILARQERVRKLHGPMEKDPGGEEKGS